MKQTITNESMYVFWKEPVFIATAVLYFHPLVIVFIKEGGRGLTREQDGTTWAVSLAGFDGCGMGTTWNAARTTPHPKKGFRSPWIALAHISKAFEVVRRSHAGSLFHRCPNMSLALSRSPLRVAWSPRLPTSMHPMRTMLGLPVLYPSCKSGRETAAAPLFHRAACMRAQPLVLAAMDSSPPWTLDQIAGLMFAGFLIVLYFSAGTVDKLVARAQRRSLGLCEECGGVYLPESCPMEKACPCLPRDAAP